jgi:conjugative relaxase-like TrwC/TraI family protein
LAPESPPVGAVEPVGQWRGRLAADLGLAGHAVEHDAFARCLGGIDPRSGDALDPRHDHVRVLAFDVVLTAPKSVSLLYALGERSVAASVEAAHERSVDAALGYFERNAALVRRSHGPHRTVVETDALLAAGFLHRTSRAPDPHLHTHLLVLNLTRDPGGRWSALDARGLFTHRRTAIALYGAHLRHELRHSAGLDFYVRKNGVADLIGARDATIAHFSRRQRAIADATAEFATPGPTTRIASHATRQPKDTTTPWSDLVDRWRESAFRAGLTTDAVNGFGRHGAWSIDTPSDQQEPDISMVVDAFPRPFTRPELTAALADRTVAGAPVERIEERVGEALDDSLVRSRSPLYYLGEQRSGVPRATPERRWVGQPVARVLDRLDGVLSTSPRWHSEVANRAIPSSAARRHLLGAGSDACTTVRATAMLAVAEGRNVVAIAPTRSAAGHFEAVTGIAVATELSGAAATDDALVVLYGPRAVSVGVLEAVLEHHDRSRSQLVVVDRTPPPVGSVPSVGRERSAHAHNADAVGGSMAPCAPTLRTVGDLSLLADLANDEIRLWLARANGVVVISVDGLDDAGAYAAPVLGPRAAAERARTTPGIAAVVLGDERVLGRSGARAFGDRRTHVVVEPLSEERRQVLERSIAVRTPDRSVSLDRRGPALGR